MRSDEIDSILEKYFGKILLKHHAKTTIEPKKNKCGSKTLNDKGTVWSKNSRPEIQIETKNPAELMKIS